MHRHAIITNIQRAPIGRPSLSGPEGDPSGIPCLKGSEGAPIRMPLLKGPWRAPIGIAPRVPQDFYLDHIDIQTKTNQLEFNKIEWGP